MYLLRKLTRRGKLWVISANSEDQSTISVSKGSMESLRLSNGEVVHVKSKSKRATVLIILADDNIDDGNARMADVVRHNLDVNDGDKISIMPCLDIKIVRVINIFR